MIGQDINYDDDNNIKREIIGVYQDSGVKQSIMDKVLRLLRYEKGQRERFSVCSDKKNDK